MALGHRLVQFLLLVISVKCEVSSPYPCVWIHSESGAILDLQLWKSNQYYWGSGTTIPAVYYSACTNSFIGTDEPYMASTSELPRESPTFNQTVAIWDDSIMPSFIIINNSYPIYPIAWWNFTYSNNSIPCLSDQDDIVLFNLSWSSRLMYAGYPRSYTREVTPDLCQATATVTAAFIYPDNCEIIFDSTTKISLNIFTHHSFQATISNDPQREILFTPCSPLYVCKDLYVQAITKQISSNECDAYLSLFVYTMSYYNNDFSRNLVANTIYYDLKYDKQTQITQYIYKTGENCTISYNETIQRLFFVYWRCNTLAQPYEITSAYKNDICTDTFTIDSIRACPNFEECIYSDDNANTQFNLTALMGINIATPFDNDGNKWLFYSVCQKVFKSKNTMITQNVTSLYKTGDFIAGEYVQNYGTHGQNFNLSRIVSFGSEFKYYYEEEEDAWLFRYTDGDLCTDPDYSIFSITWQCGGDAMWLYQIEQAIVTDCVDSIVISTSLC